MNWPARFMDWLRPDGPDAAPSVDELDEAKELRHEQKRHIDAIEKHVNAVGARVRADFEEAEAHLPARKSR